MANKNSMEKVNKKQLIFMKIMMAQTIQFAECNEEDALDFIMTILDKMEKEKVRIK